MIYMDSKEIIKKLVDKEKNQEILTGKLKTQLLVKYNLDLNLDEIRDMLLLDSDLIELEKNFFVYKLEIEKIIDSLEEEKYKEKIEQNYFINITDEILEKIKIKLKKMTYNDILKFGLENFYVKEEWIHNLDLTKTEFYDKDEVVRELLKKGIEIK